LQREGGAGARRRVARGDLRQLQLQGQAAGNIKTRSMPNR
jgi:hypothetical protein